MSIYSTEVIKTINLQEKSISGWGCHSYWECNMRKNHWPCLVCDAGVRLRLQREALRPLHLHHCPACGPARSAGCRHRWHLAPQLWTNQPIRCRELSASHSFIIRQSYTCADALMSFFYMTRARNSCLSTQLVWLSAPAEKVILLKIS